MSIYTDSTDTRIKRIEDTIASRDYEGTTTVLTSDLVELLNHIANLKQVLLFERD